MNKYTQYLKHLCLAAVMLTTATTQDAEEIPITGEAFFTGSGFGMQSGGISTLTFNNPKTFTFGTGDYSVITPGTPAIWFSISVNRRFWISTRIVCLIPCECCVTL